MDGRNDIVSGDLSSQRLSFGISPARRPAAESFRVSAACLGDDVDSAGRASSLVLLALGQPRERAKSVRGRERGRSCDDDAEFAVRRTVSEARVVLPCKTSTLASV